MLSSNKLYESGLGDRLADQAYHPKHITKFLHEELRIMNSIEGSKDLLIEVGCMHGLYLDWAIAHKKYYIGIDIVERYIETGRRTVARLGLSNDIYQFIVGDAEDLADVISQQQVPVAHDRCLLFFPFNSFGNMQDAERVITSLKRCEMPFYISSYQTTQFATDCRHEYYTLCGYKDVHYFPTEKGICFLSSDGLHSMAYYPGYLKSLCEVHGLTIDYRETQPFNVSYTRGVSIG
jgi:hypothetical protein